MYVRLSRVVRDVVDVDVDVGIKIILYTCTNLVLLVLKIIPTSYKH